MNKKVKDNGNGEEKVPGALVGLMDTAKTTKRQGKSPV